MTVFKSLPPICFILFCLTLKSSGGSPDPHFQNLIRRLISEGMDSSSVMELFQAERVPFLPGLIKYNLIPNDVPDVYQGFLTVAQIADGYEFMQKHREEIAAPLVSTNVPVEIIISLLKVESDLGRATGRYPILASLSTITLLGDSLHWVAQFDTSGGGELERQQKRARKRAEWAYRELKDFLVLCHREGWNPTEVKGSWAGAFGLGQFLPSSYMRCGCDGNGDGILDPFNLQDAVASVASYLQESRWSDNETAQRKALLLYNPSDNYVDCILKYAQKLRDLSNTGETQFESSRTR